MLPGFTVISGPNGSGKSNILDALLFALGLSSSKGMRAERLPDLVNQTQSGRGRSVIEASVTATFALEGDDWQMAFNEDEADDLPDLEEDAIATESSAPSETNGNGNGQVNNGNGDGHNGNGQAKNAETSRTFIPITATEWTVTRKLRVTQQGTYTSNYFINGQPCSLTELHEHLQKFRIYPEGYNVVLQGDVTGIISMPAKERREIIDELAGVAAFDRKINQAKDKLDAVKEREEKFRIVERELIDQRDRLAQDRIKAEKYQRLRAELENKSQWEGVLVFLAQEKKAKQVTQQIAEGDRQQTQLAEQIAALNQEIQQANQELERLNARVKALGEDEQLALQATLATREAELRQLERQQQELANSDRELMVQIERTQREIQEQAQALDRLLQERQRLETSERVTLQQQRDQAQQELDRSRENASATAAAVDAWIQEQTALRRQIESLTQALEPHRTEQARLQERVEQLRLKIQEQNDALVALSQGTNQNDYNQLLGTLRDAQQQVEVAQQAFAAAEQDLQTQQDTQNRLLQEQREKQRQLDKLEAQVQAMQETQGSGILKVLQKARMVGICGLVAQLGKVEPQYQLALEIAAGARLGCLVMQDDEVAARAIDLLKQQRAGRATFLPLNKIRAPRIDTVPVWNRPDGFIDYAANLIECDDRYQAVFAYVFGNTVVFKSLQQARREMGQYRIVTLDGELLESSGAMTGGSLTNREGALHFGTVEPGESAEAHALRDRLQEIDRVLAQCERAIAQAVVTVRERSQALMDARQHHREIQLQAEQLQNQLANQVTQEGHIRAQLSQNSQELANAQNRLLVLEQSIPRQEAQLQQQQQALVALETSQTHSEWQHIQDNIRSKEALLNEKQLALQSVEQRIKDLESQHQRLQERKQTAEQRIQEFRAQQTKNLNQQTAMSTQHAELVDQIGQTQMAIAALEKTLASEKQERDRAERQLRDRQTSHQQLEWQQQKLQETLQTRRQELATLQAQLAEQRADLPDPLPEIPENLGLEQLQQELRSLQKRLQAMEPVNMLALEEYDRTQARLEELSQKLSTLDEERNELLLRIENFTTLRQRAFKEAFDAVNRNFQSIFAELSDGDGYLQLDDPNDPFAGGLNLVAHPKGKPVRRLASMSGGEKSLTALSFIFALQRYRPSSFYAFDEVDMFLDGANVERLARMIKHQAQQAQFIVVSLRRPMIESAQRTIGVTQARGAYTQVIGMDLQSPPSPSPSSGSA